MNWHMGLRSKVDSLCLMHRAVTLLSCLDTGRYRNDGADYVEDGVVRLKICMAGHNM